MFIRASFSFLFSLQKWLVYFLLKRIYGEFIGIKHLTSKKNDIIFRIPIKLRFQWYRCKSGIANFGWKEDSLKITFTVPLNQTKPNLDKNPKKLRYCLLCTMFPWKSIKASRSYLNYFIKCFPRRTRAKDLILTSSFSEP